MIRYAIAGAAVLAALSGAALAQSGMPDTITSLAPIGYETDGISRIDAISGTLGNIQPQSGGNAASTTSVTTTDGTPRALPQIQDATPAKP